MDWTLWNERRPTDKEKVYQWRVSPRLILGLEMQPEWSGKLRLCGMGLRDSEWWPPFSSWDGYRRTVDSTLEWRESDVPDEPTKWNGLDLLPCPFTGASPTIVAHGQYIGAPPYKLQWIGVRSFMIDSLGWTSAQKMADAWNTRPAPKDAP